MQDTPFRVVDREHRSPACSYGVVLWDLLPQDQVWMHIERSPVPARGPVPGHGIPVVGIDFAWSVGVAANWQRIPEHRARPSCPRAEGEGQTPMPEQE